MSTGLDFTTLARVRNVLSFEDIDQSRDAEISRLIRAVSGDMEDEMRRYFKTAAYTEIIDLWPPNRMLALAATPVLDTPAPIVEGSNTRNFVDDATLLERSVDFVLENDTGKIRMLGTLRGVRDPVSSQVLGPTYIRVQYTGGVALTQNALELAYPRLAEACELQVAFEYKRRQSPGGNLVVGAASTNFEQPLNWLPLVRRVLEYHKRRSIY